jgi:hypothetical protein
LFALILFKSKLLKYIIHILVFINLSFGLKAQTETLNIGGTISGEDDVAMQGVQVTVTKNGQLFTSFPTTYSGAYNLFLPMGAEFVVSITKDGYAKKYFTVSTMGVPAESAKKKFAVMIADLELIALVPGVDYSVFNQPVNKYYFDPKADNFDYDKKYLKDVIAQVQELKKAKKEAIAAAKLKAEQDKKNTDLAAEKAKQDALLAAEQAKSKKLQEEKSITSTPTVTPTKTEAVSTTNPSILSEGVLVLKDNTLIVYPKSKKLVNALILKYTTGVTEEIILGPNVVIIQRILVRNEDAWVYHKKTFNWGGVSCFRDGAPITEGVFEYETRKTI